MNVLIIDDTRTIPTLIERTLQSYGYVPHTITSKHNIASHLKSFPLSLVIINTALMHAESTDICTHIREKHPNTFILGIQSRGSWESRVEFLQNGADDCLSFPFPTQELLARIHAMLRRPRRSTSPHITYGKILIKPEQRKAFYSNTPLDLTRKEYQVLEYFVRNKDRTITRSELLDHVWDYKRIINSNTVDVHIQKLRKKMRSNGRKRDEHASTNELPRQSTYKDTEIQTVHGIGYRLEGNIPSPGTKDSRTPPPVL